MFNVRCSKFISIKPRTRNLSPPSFPSAGFPCAVVVLAFLVVGIAAIRSRRRIGDCSAIVAVIAVIAVVVTVVGIVAGALVQVLMGMRSVVVPAAAESTTAAPPAMTAAMASAPVAVGLNAGDIEAQGCQENQPDHQEIQPFAFHEFHFAILS